MKKKILLVITGSVAAYKSLDLIRILKKSDYEVTPLLTKAASEFITPLLVSSISGNDVYQDLFSLDEESKMGHINLSRDNDLIVVAPATADIISKMSNAIADDLASTVLLAANKQIVVVPAMNEKMWLNKQNQENLTKLRNQGIKILEPQVDVLACGEYGVGKMMTPEEIFSNIETFFKDTTKLRNKNVLITTGATYEAIDPVRFIGNYSSGKQGIAIAEILNDMGANVKLIASNVTEHINLNSKDIIRTRSADDMMDAVSENLKDNDIFISAAAVADFKPKNYSSHKIKKSEKSLDKIELEENIDILKTVGNGKNRPKIVVGFAAESDDLIKNADRKLDQKNCDMIIANDVRGGKLFGSNNNQISILRKDHQVQNYDKTTKIETARIIVDNLLQII